MVTRADLLDRSIVLHLPSLSTAQRRDEKRLWQDFDEVKPRILGSLLDAVSVALRDHDRIILPALPRMADFARWACAAAPACGWRPEAFLHAYSQSTQAANDGFLNDGFLERSPITRAVQDLVKNLNGASIW